MRLLILFTSALCIIGSIADQPIIHFRLRQKTDTPFIYMTTPHTDVKHYFHFPTNPRIDFNLTTNGNCDTEPPGLEIYCERKADHYAVEVKIRGLDNERDYFSAYWNAWYSTVKTPATRVAVFEGGVSMPVINRLMWQEERDSKTEVKLIEKRENKIVVGCGLPNLFLGKVVLLLLVLPLVFVLLGEVELSPLW